MTTVAAAETYRTRADEEATRLPLAEALEDAEIYRTVDAAVIGDPGAFSEIYARYRPEIMCYLGHLGALPHELDDLAQDTFTNAWGAMSRFNQGEDGVRPWLYRIAHNRFVSARRRAHKFRFDSLEDDTSEIIPEAELAQVSRPFDELLAARTDLPTHLANLFYAHPAFGEVVRLIDLEGMTYEEAAVALNREIGTIRSQLHRGRKMIKKAGLPPGYSYLSAPSSTE